ncbi:MAG: hypothetical protein JW889_03725 [Verrucomicrobia bacterium]|nr:hypothetical protein [Verrucomicrobiota bacterium]
MRNLAKGEGRLVLTLLVVAIGAAVLAGCGESKQVVIVPIGPEPVPITLDQLIAKAKAGESDWALIWAVRQSRRAWPLTTADIERLNNAGASERTINFMLETVTATRLYRPVPMTAEEVVGLTAAGVPDEKITAEIAATGTIFHLQAADVLDLREKGVSDRVIDFMLYTRQLERQEQIWYVQPVR